MSLMILHFSFIAALRDHLGEIRARLGDDWSNFNYTLLALLDRLTEEEDSNVCEILVQNIFAHTASTPVGLEFTQWWSRQLDASILYGVPESPIIVSSTPLGAVYPAREMQSPMRSRESISRSDIAEISRALARDLRATLPEERRETPRYFNIFLTEADGQKFVGNDEPLIRNHSYRLCVEINPEQRGLGNGHDIFPDRALDEVRKEQETLSLLVVAASRDFEISPQVQRIDLPPEGTSSMARFSVRPLFAGNRGVLQVEVFYRGHLLQSKMVQAFAVAHVGDPVAVTMRPLQTAHTTFSTTDRFTSDMVALTPDRVLTIDVQRDERDQSVDMRFLDRTNGEEEIAYFDNTLQPQSLGDAVKTVREQLAAIIEGESGNAQKVAGYKWILDGTPALLHHWLPQLADTGRSLYRALLSKGAVEPGEDKGERLKVALRPGAVIQINPIVGKVTIPWSILYERPVLLMPGQTRVCEKYMEAGPECPECQSLKDPTVICPYGFWGYRYAIEQLPGWVNGELPQPLTLVRQISNGRPLLLNLNVWQKFPLWQEHNKKLLGIGEVQSLVAGQLVDLIKMWQQYGAELDMIYFYTHGGIDKRQPYLEVSDGKITSNFLESCNPNWPHHPLVFLNGCSTGSYGPESYVSLIDDFRKAGAAGVIGTECAVPELFAESYATALFPRLFRGERVGHAMLEVRLEFLKRHNPLGLVYSLYASNDIRLASPVSNSDRQTAAAQ